MYTYSKIVTNWAGLNQRVYKQMYLENNLK